MQKTIAEVIAALDPDKIGVQPVIPGLMQISLATKKSPGFIKIAVEDHVAANFMRAPAPRIGLLLLVDQEDWDKVVRSE